MLQKVTHHQVRRTESRVDVDLHHVEAWFRVREDRGRRLHNTKKPMKLPGWLAAHIMTMGKLTDKK